MRVTTEILWRGAVIFALLDAGFVTLLARRITTQRLRELKWSLVAAGAAYWCAMWVVMALVFWEPVYHYVFPGWAHWVIPPVYTLLFAGVSLATWWLAFRLPVNPVVALCLLGGAWGMVTHVWAAYRGIFERPPMLRGASPVAGVVIAGFEFTFYWCVMLSIASLLRWGWDRSRRRGASLPQQSA